MKRIVILGHPGSGKTTLAKKFSQELNLPHLEVDEIFWNENLKFKTEISKRLSQEKWIIEGHFTKIEDDLEGRAEAYFWLRPGFTRSLIRFLRREKLENREGLWPWLKSYRQREACFRSAFQSAQRRGLFTQVLGASAQDWRRVRI